MLSSPYTIASRDYALIGNDLTKSVRAVGGLASGNARIFTISKATAKILGQVNDRHLIRLDLNKPDAAGLIWTASCYSVINIPRGGPFTIAEQTGNATGITWDIGCVLTAGNGADVARIIAGEL